MHCIGWHMAMDCYWSVVHIPTVVYVSAVSADLSESKFLIELQGCCGGLKCEGYTTTWDAILAITVARILGTDFDQAWDHEIMKHLFFSPRRRWICLICRVRWCLQMHLYSSFCSKCCWVYFGVMNVIMVLDRIPTTVLCCMLWTWMHVRFEEEQREGSLRFLFGWGVAFNGPDNLISQTQIIDYGNVLGLYSQHMLHRRTDTDLWKRILKG